MGRYLSIAEKAAIVRAELKKAGYNSRKVGVKSGYCGYSTYIDVTVKDLDADMAIIKKIANQFDKVAYDERSGEILEGGNTYITINTNYKNLEEEATKLIPFLDKFDEKLEACEENELIKIFENNDYYILYTPKGRSYLPELNLEKKRIYTYEGKSWNGSDVIERQVAETKAIAASVLVVWQHRYKLDYLKGAY